MKTMPCCKAQVPVRKLYWTFLWGNTGKCPSCGEEIVKIDRSSFWARILDALLAAICAVAASMFVKQRTVWSLLGFMVSLLLFWIVADLMAQLRSEYRLKERSLVEEPRSAFSFDIVTWTIRPAIVAVAVVVLIVFVLGEIRDIAHHSTKHWP